MVRIFVSPSHLCTLYMILYARSTRKEGYKDILVLDSPPKKRSLIDLIKSTKKIYAWHDIIDLSTPLDDSVDLVVNTKKKLTRKLKTKPGIKQLYDFLLKRHNKKQRDKESRMISEKLATLGDVIEINVLTQTQVNAALFGLFPKAQINYFEHGVGDYYYVEKIKQKHNFYCVFAGSFKKLLAEKGADNTYVKQLPGYENFPAIAQEVLEKEDVELMNRSKIEGKMILVLGEAMQLYQVPDSYYLDFIDLVMKQVKDPQNYTFVIKPHPSQTHRSLEAQKQHLLEHYKVRTVVLEGGQFANFSVEVLFSVWKDQTDYFFSNFSSAGFYNSILYKNSATKFYYSYDFFLDYMQNAPSQFKEAYLGSEQSIRKVFGMHCIVMA